MLESADTETPVLVCGLLAYDIVFKVDNIPSEAVKYKAESVRLNCGGGGCYASVAINRLGGSSVVLARVGSDDFGKQIFTALKSEGIDHTKIFVDPYVNTPISSVFVSPSGDRQIVNWRDHMPIECSRELKFDSTPQAVLVDARWLDGSMSALEYAKSNNVPSVIDAESPVSEEAMALSTHIAFSRQGLSQFASTDSLAAGLRKAASRFSAWVCVTDGSEGTHVWRGNRVETIPAPKIDAVDTLGAGDVWHGAFTLLLAQGAEELNAVKFANVAAALKCTRVGGGWSAPKLSEVSAFYASGCE